MNIVLPDGSKEGIALLPHTSGRVTLGISTSPDGDDFHHLHTPGKARDKWRSVSTRASVWLDRLKNGHLPPKYSWVSYRLQLWSSVRYGLGTLSAPLAQLGELTANFAFRALPYLGVNRNIKAEWRYLHNSFGGVGLLSLSAEATIARVNLFMQHWGMSTPIGQMLQASMEALQLEIGCVGCPLRESFYPLGPLATHCWLRSFWEVVDKYKLVLEVDYPEVPLPRQNDVTIMSIAMSLGLQGDDLLSIIRCRLSCCSIFLSDITSANGRYLDPTRGQPGVDYGPFSQYTHPRERPSQQDWLVWDRMWSSYCYADGSLPRSLGKWLHHSHRLWEWFYLPTEDVIVQRVGLEYWAFRPCLDSDYIRTRARHRYARVCPWHPKDLNGCLPTTV